MKTMDKRGQGFQNKPDFKSNKIEDKIVENLIQLQKVNLNLAEKFDKLSNQIAALLTLFETAARSFATSPIVQASEKDKEFLDKINRLLDQNKTIAKGLTLMEEKIRDKVYDQSVPNPVEHSQVTPAAQPAEIQEKTEVHPEDEFKPSLSGKPMPKF
jgi:hypothetical protein